MAKQASETPCSHPAAAPPWSWVEASIWTERMLAALEKGVRGGKWFSLIDKVYRPETLQLAWQRVASKGGGSGVDGQSLESFGRPAPQYLQELSEALRKGEYRAQAVRGVSIPKGKGQWHRLGIPTISSNCTFRQHALGMGGGLSSLSPAARPAFPGAEDAAAVGRRDLDSERTSARQRQCAA